MNKRSESIGSVALPSNRQLAKATAIAIATAAAILVVAVLPAEYGIDPTGIGRLLRLTSLSSQVPQAQSEATPPSSASASLNLDLAPSALLPVWKSPVVPRADTLTLDLKPGQGAEIKALMKTGERFVFAWTAAGGSVSFDMHGEKAGTPDGAFSSYWKARDASAGNGEFAAPFDGTHGWYWHNRGDKPVTITVTTTGFYEKLYQPEPSAPAAPPIPNANSGDRK